MVMRAAYALAERALPTYSSPFSRHDYTLPQLFACLTLREMFNRSYRGVEALLRDSPDWLADIGLDHAPDHNTLCRAFGVIVTLRRVNKMLDVTAEWFTEARVLDLTRKPLAADSTHFESHHVSRHYERRQKQTAEKQENAQRPGEASKSLKSPDKAGSRTRSDTTRKLPKATFAVAAACHLVLSVAVSTGAGSDAPSLDQLLYDAWRRAPVKTVVADAGFDSEKNHRIARLDMAVRSIIPPEIGRPRKDGGPPAGRFRRLMHHRFKRKADKKMYGQRWQSETTNSMVKRNQSSALRARTPERREREMLLRAVVHNVTLA
jgi:IS5 family transposase